MKFFTKNKYTILAIVWSLFLGILVRFPYLTSKDMFPFGDGGLFVEMIYAIKNNHYLLPQFVNYNGYEIPFAYPPFGFYLALLWAKIFNTSILASVQLLPVVINLLTIVAFVLLVKQLTTDNIELFISASIFPIVLQTYLWTVKGGGLSRSPGFFFTTLTLCFFLLYHKQDKRIYLLLSAIAFGLTIASHLEWGLITAASLTTFVLSFGKFKTKSQIFSLFLFGVTALFITSPWWGTVINRFGIIPFLSAWNIAEATTSQFFEKFIALAMFRITIFSAKDYFLATLGMIGFVLALFKKERWLLPIWLMVTYVVAPKNSPISGLLPLILLITYALRNIDKGFLFLVQKTNKNIKPNISFIYIFALIYLSVPQLTNKPIVSILSPVERTAMEYVKENTEPDSTFIILTPTDWHSADAAEWFPYLTQRQSLTTPQGLEWVSASEFNRIIAQVAILSQMVRSEQTGIEIGQLASYVDENFKEYDYLAIFANNIESNFGGFIATGNYEIFYRKSDVLILRLK